MWLLFGFLDEQADCPGDDRRGKAGPVAGRLVTIRVIGISNEAVAWGDDVGLGASAACGSEARMLRARQSEVGERCGKVVAADRVHNADADNICAGGGVEGRIAGALAIANGGDEYKSVLLGERLDAPCPPGVKFVSDAGGDYVGIGRGLGEDVVNYEVPEFINICIGVRGDALIAEPAEVRLEGFGVPPEEN